MPDYESTLFTPPAPVAFVSFENPDNQSKIENVPMLIDTGADATMIPEFVVRRFDLNYQTHRFMKRKHSMERLGKAMWLMSE